MGAAPAPSPPVYVPLPTDKLSCKLPPDRQAFQRPPPFLCTCERVLQGLVTFCCRDVWHFVARVCDRGGATHLAIAAPSQVVTSQAHGKHMPATYRHTGAQRQPVALLACGSFNPPTIAHLRMFELASDALREVT